MRLESKTYKWMLLIVSELSKEAKDNIETKIHDVIFIKPREVAGPICTNRPDYLKASVVEQLYYLQTISDETIQLKGKNYPMQKAV